MSYMIASSITLCILLATGFPRCANMDYLKNTVIVTHGGVIAAIIEDLYPNERKNRYERQPSPGYGYVISDGTFRSNKKALKSYDFRAFLFILSF